MKIGDRIGDRFTLEREIGIGGMSTVYLGRDEVLDREVAVKILRGGLDDEDSSISERFEREGRTAARLSHANVVQVYDAGKDTDANVSYIVMEYVSGGDLKDLIDREGAIPEKKLTTLGADIAAGLEHAHERGIVHRDIKPQNVLIDEYGKPKLTDFGIARALDGNTHMTNTGSYLGTALYSAPEQLRGEAVTPKSDVYSLGMTLYHAATGAAPFAGSPIEVATQQMTREPPPPRSVGARITPDTEELIISCLSKEPDDRPSSTELKERLVRAGASGAAVPASDGNTREVRQIFGRPDETVSLPTRTFQSSRSGRDRGPLIVGAVAVIFVLALLLGAWALLGGGGGPQVADDSGGGNGQQDGGGAGNNGSNDQGSGGATTSGETTVTATAPEVTIPPEETTAPEATQASDDGPLPPTQGAADAVYDMYVALPFGRYDESWGYLSERYQQEVGSVEEWERRYEPVSYVGVASTPQATLDGREARVDFGFDLTRTDGDETVSGTWVCVNEDGEWKLDRLIED